MKKLLFPLLILFVFQISSAQPFQTSIKYENKTRKFIVYLPQDYQPGESLPLVINMHAFLGSAAGQMNYTKYNRLADSARCIVVYPNGIGGRWNSGTFFGISSNIDDVGFIGRLIDYMDLLYNIDTRMVYATGFSAGGFMSYKLACEIPNRITAIAPVAASMVPEGNFDNCFPNRSVPVLAVNSVNDPITQYNGFVSVTPIENVIGLWSEINNCFGQPDTIQVPNINASDNSTVKRITYQNCDASLEFLKQFNAGHTWPGANPTFILGNTNQDISATNESWNFFKNNIISEEIYCDEPSNLSFEIQEEEIILSWNAIDGAAEYTLFGILPNGENIYVENILNNSIGIPITQTGSFVWAVSSDCESGHVNWSSLQTNSITGRIAANINIEIFPNPSSNIVTFNTPSYLIGADYYILNSFGLIKEKGVISDISTQINIQDWANGWHTLRIPSQNIRRNFFKL